MSTSDAPALDEGLGQQSTDSIYDFLYHDARRVGSFLAQMVASGHLTALKQTETAETASSVKFGGSASAAIVVARAGGTFEDQSTAGERQSIEKSFDPYWSNALALLDLLDERDMIHRGIRSARIGQFVLISGSISVLDLTLFKGMWEVPAVRKVIQAGLPTPATPMQNRHDRRGAGTKRQQGSPESSSLDPVIDIALSLMGMLPHTIQCNLLAEDQVTEVWCSLREDGLVVSASDITLKHGAALAGSWTMLGVLDALPDEAGGLAAFNAPTSQNASLLDAARGIMPAIRAVLGRPGNAWGMTPLLLFREVASGR